MTNSTNRRKGRLASFSLKAALILCGISALVISRYAKARESFLAEQRLVEQIEVALPVVLYS